MTRTARPVVLAILCALGGGTIADARADGTEENGVHDVSARDFTTLIHVIASYENGVFVLRPLGVPGIVG